MGVIRVREGYRYSPTSTGSTFLPTKDSHLDAISVMVFPDSSMSSMAWNSLISTPIRMTERCEGWAQSNCSIVSDGWLSSAMSFEHAPSRLSRAPCSPFFSPSPSFAMLSTRARAPSGGGGVAVIAGRVVVKNADIYTPQHKNRSNGQKNSTASAC